MVDKRSEARLSISLDVAYQLQNEIPIKVITTIKDASPHGLRLYTDDVIPQGTRISIEIYIPDNSGSLPVNATGEVCWSIKTDDQSFETGLKLAEIHDNGEYRWLQYINNCMIR